LYENASFFEDNYYWRRVLTFSLPNGSSYTVGLNLQATLEQITDKIITDVIKGFKGGIILDIINYLM